MAQQTFSGVPGTFSAGEVLTAADQEKLRDFILYLIKDGDETDTGEVSPLILDLGNDRVGVNEAAPASALVVRLDNGGGRGGEVSVINLASAEVGSEAALNFGLENSTYAADAGNCQIKGYLEATNGATATVFSGYTGGAYQENVRIVSNGDVGIGTDAPNNILHLAGTTANHRLVFTNTANDEGERGMSIGFDNGRMAFQKASDAGVWEANYMTIEQDTGAVHVANAFSKGSGSFDIPHPTKGGDWRLRHSFIEGPQADLIYRGTVTLSGGAATIDLDTASHMTDGTWEALCRDPWSMVASSGNAVEWSLSGKTLTMTSDTADAVCSWIVIAERQDDHMKGDDCPLCDDDGHFVTEYEKEPVPDPWPLVRATDAEAAAAEDLP